MSSKNYRRGTDAERRLRGIFQARGYWVERAHASKGTFDLIASGYLDTYLIQVKRTKRRIVSPKAVANANREDIERMAEVPHPPDVRVELWLYTDRQKGQIHGTWRRFAVTPSASIDELSPEVVTS